MAETHWARLQAAVEGPLRRGAWYRVVSLTQRDAVVDVPGGQVRVPRPSVEIRTTRPLEWTIVRTAERGPANLQSGYVVCPECRQRAVLPFAQVPKLWCPRCNQLFAIAWTEV